MNDLSLYFETGWHHIIGWNALDHILFIVALTAIYLPGNWKQVLILVTAFTIGHSVTLALSVYDIVRVNERLVELLIPFTILATAAFNMVADRFSKNSLRLNYLLTLFFGLIHGLGFANTIRFMLSQNQNIGWPLLSFNVGLEVGQIVIVSIIFTINFICIATLGISKKWWIYSLSIISILLSMKMIVERLS